jgi:hypothetical protein
MLRNDPLVPAKQWKTEMGFRTWDVSSLHESGPLTAAARELARYKLD